MARPISRAELARMFGFSRAAATKRCQGAWAAACDRDRVDIDHPLIRAAALKKGIDIGEIVVTDGAPTDQPKRAQARAPEPTHVAEPATLAPVKPTKRRREVEPLPSQPDNAGSPEDLSELAHLVRPLVARFGTERGFRDWLLSLKDIEVIRGKQLDYANARGLLLPREFVRAHVLGLIEGANHRLLSDTPKTLCRELYALAKSGAPLEEAERTARKLLGKQLESVKAKAIAAIKNAGVDRGNVGGSSVAGKPGRDSDDRNGVA